MEMIICKKYGGRIELKVAVQYRGDDNVCRSCLNYDICYDEKEVKEDGKQKE